MLDTIVISRNDPVADSRFQFFWRESMESRIGMDQSLTNPLHYNNSYLKMSHASNTVIYVLRKTALGD